MPRERKRTVDLSLFVAAVLVVAGILALEVGISTAITEIVAGVLLTLFVDTSGLGWLDFLAHFGLLGLMFMAGFEVDPNVARRRWASSAGIGAFSFLVPFGGVFLACWWGFGLSAVVAALLGIGLSTTSLALVYGFLRERELLGGDGGQMVLGAAMVVDLLSMIGLALLLGDLGWATAIFVLGAVPAFIGLPRLGAWIFERYGGGAAEFELRFLLLILVGLGVLSERVGIHAAVVSFVAGLVLSETVQDHEALEEKLKGVVFSFFAPVFFLKAGTSLDVRGIDLEGAVLTGVLFAIAVGLKYAATAGAAYVFAPALAHFAGVLFNYRLSFGIITATVGLQVGLLDQQLFGAILLVVLLSAALPMLLLRDLPSELTRRRRKR
ncbi:MAG: cation:proton antiporter [Candidatus Rokubacteria bacterium]|nr:cation:proton antiporter [Candidatus Rokubacteria bacterium]